MLTKDAADDEPRGVDLFDDLHAGLADGTYPS
jgi:hypothetical protein